MDHRIEAKNANEANLALKRFNDFHDGYVEKIEIKFEIIDFTTYLFKIYDNHATFPP